MRKKNYPDFDALNIPDDNESFGMPEEKPDRIAWLSGTAFSLVKFVLGLCLLPFVYSVAASFITELGRLSQTTQDYFWWGMLTLVLVHFFVWEPYVLYTRGHKILEFVFAFTKPLVKVAPYLFPIYTILISLAYIVLSMSVKESWVLNWSVYGLGLTMALHLIYAAKTVRGKKNDFLKANYIFGFSCVFIINVLFLSFCFNALFQGYSLVDFMNRFIHSASDVFYAIFRQLFLNQTG